MYIAPPLIACLPHPYGSEGWSSGAWHCQGALAIWIMQIQLLVIEKNTKMLKIRFSAGFLNGRNLPEKRKFATECAFIIQACWWKKNFNSCSITGDMKHSLVFKATYDKFLGENWRLLKFGIYSGSIYDCSYIKTLPNTWWKYWVIACRLYYTTLSCFHHIPDTNVIGLLLLHVVCICTDPSAIFPGSKTTYLDMFTSSLSKSGIFLFYMKQCYFGYVVILKYARFIHVL